MSTIQSSQPLYQNVLLNNVNHLFESIVPNNIEEKVANDNTKMCYIIMSDIRCCQKNPNNIKQLMTVGKDNIVKYNKNGLCGFGVFDYETDIFGGIRRVSKIHNKFDNLLKKKYFQQGEKNTTHVNLFSGIRDVMNQASSMNKTVQQIHLIFITDGNDIGSNIGVTDLQKLIIKEYQNIHVHILLTSKMAISPSNNIHIYRLHNECIRRSKCVCDAKNWEYLRDTIRNIIIDAKINAMREVNHVSEDVDDVNEDVNENINVDEDVDEDVNNEQTERRGRKRTRY
jgi:hypothetical protein